MLVALWWWLVAQVIAAVALPLVLVLFRPLGDRGYGLSKAAGLLAFGYVAWLAGSTRLVPNGFPAFTLALLIIGAGSFWTWRREGPALLDFLRRRRGLLLLQEAIGLGAFLGFLAIRSYVPDIQGTEKFMDFSFLNAITRSGGFPPLDPWLAPSAAVPSPTINYYYFGYLIQALLVMVSLVEPAVGFNLALGLLFGFTATGVFSLVYNVARDVAGADGSRRLVRRVAPPVASPDAPSDVPLASSPKAPRDPAALPSGTPIAVLPAASAAASFAVSPVVHTLQLLPTPRTPGQPRGMAPAQPAGRTRPLPTWSIRAAWPLVAAGLLAVYLLLVSGNLWTALKRFDGSGMWQKGFWDGIGWNATRVLVIKRGDMDLDYTINEFPVFSFLLGDLHPHVLALPFVILALGLAYTWLLHPPALFRWAMRGPQPHLAESPADADPDSDAGGGIAADSLDSDEGAGTSAWRVGLRRMAPLGEVLAGAVILGSLYFLNSWDFPAYFAMAMAGATAGAWWEQRQERGEAQPGRDEWTTATSFAMRGGRTLVATGLTGALALVLFAPFHLTFRPPIISDAGSLPIGLVVTRSQLDQFLQFWGIQLLLVLPCVLAGLVLRGHQRGAVAPGATGAAQPAATGATQGGPRNGSPADEPATPLAGWLSPDSPLWEPALLLVGGTVAVLIANRAGSGALALCLLLALGSGTAALRALQSPRNYRPLAFAFGAICLAAALLATCEVVYIRDFYGGALRRMNTVFKLYYQAWVLFAAGGSIATFWLLRQLWRGEPRSRAARRAAPGARMAVSPAVPIVINRPAYPLPFAALAALGLVLLFASVQYPYKVTLLRTDSFHTVGGSIGIAPTLHGMNWMQRLHPEDFAAAEWLRVNGLEAGEPAPVVAEASGGAYSDFARVATQTGFPTILGWDQHERLWRGARINAEVETRQRDLDALYASRSLEEAAPILDKYRVRYIMVGYLEQQKYASSGGLSKFDGAAGKLQVAFRQGQTTLYRVVRPS